MNDKIAAATKTIEDLTAHSSQALEGFIKAGQEQAEKVSQQLFQGYDDIASFSKQNVDAVVQSSTIVAKGAEEAGKAVAAYAQVSLEKGVATGKALMGAKTLKDVIDLQTSFAKQSFDAFMAESTRLSELSVKVTNEALAPINARVNAAVEKFGKPIAA
ncbi:MAG TPA: phasin family protein [Azospirillaceae bacterium]|nr:phasin family protein [Azospirillaceae bacterium]